MLPVIRPVADSQGQRRRARKNGTTRAGCENVKGMGQKNAGAAGRGAQPLKSRGKPPIFTGAGLFALRLAGQPREKQLNYVRRLE